MRNYLLASSVAIAALLAGQAQAQTADESTGGIEEIVVTAQKRAENIQDVPLSIQSVSGDTLKNSNVDNPVALQKLVPSLQINNTLFGSGVVIRIRGFGSAANTAVDSEVASYIDGAYVPRSGAVLGSFLDVKNVEVLNGPQGTLFGRNATMGAISINTNAPQIGQQSFSGSIEAGNYKTYVGTAIANLPVGDTFAVRFAIKGASRGGVYKNLKDGKTYGDSDSVVARLSTKWEIAPSVTWTLRGDYSKTDGDGVFPQTVYSNTATPTAVANFQSFITRNGSTPQVISSKPSYTINQTEKNPFADDKQYGLTSELAFDVNEKAQIRLINSYRDWHNDQQTGDTIATSLDMLAVHTISDSKSNSHELQFVSDKDAYLDGKLGVTAGLYYFHEKFSLNTDFNFGTQFCNVVLSRAPAAIPACLAAPQTQAAITRFGQTAKSYAAYVQLDYQIVPTLNLALGARHTWDRKSGALSATRNNPGASALVTTTPRTPLRFRDDKTSIRASLSWNITDDIMAFGTFSTGYKSGGFNTQPFPPFGSTTVDDYELGFKSVLLDGKVRLNVTAFNTKLKDFQDRSFNGTAFTIRNAGDVRSKGVDVDGQIAPTRNLSFTFGASYLDSQYTNNIAAPGLEGCTGTPTCPLVQNLTGRTLAFAPKIQGNVGAQYTFEPIMDGYQITVAGSTRFTKGFLTANTLNPQSRVPGYRTTDLRLSVTSPDKAWQFDIFGTNVFNRRYLVTTVAQVLGAVMGVNDAATGSTLYRGFLGDPRRYGVRVSARF